MSGCTGRCDQGRTCTCCEPLTPEESRKFWRVIWTGIVVNIGLVVLILHAAKRGWIE